jgi:hypothetical protein
MDATAADDLLDLSAGCDVATESLLVKGLLQLIEPGKLEGQLVLVGLVRESNALGQ